MPPLIVRVGISDQPGDTRHCMYLSRTYSCQARFVTARFSHSLVLCLSGPTPSAMVKQLKQWTHINETEFEILEHATARLALQGHPGSPRSV